MAAIITQELPALGRVQVMRPSYRGTQGVLEVWLDLSAVPDAALTVGH